MPQEEIKQKAREYSQRISSYKAVREGLEDAFEAGYAAASPLPSEPVGLMEIIQSEVECFKGETLNSDKCDELIANLHKVVSAVGVPSLHSEGQPVEDGTCGIKVGDVVPYRNTRSNIKQATVVATRSVSNGKIWFDGIDTVTGASVFYPCHISKELMQPTPKEYAEERDSLSRELSSLQSENERLKAEREWIPVSERLPEIKGSPVPESDSVLVHQNGAIFIAWLNDLGRWVENTEVGTVFGLDIWPITHWMPLPTNLPTSPTLTTDTP